MTGFSNVHQLRELRTRNRETANRTTFPKVEAHSAFVISTREGRCALCLAGMENKAHLPGKEIVLVGANNAAADNIVYDCPALNIWTQRSRF